MLVSLQRQNETRMVVKVLTEDKSNEFYDILEQLNITKSEQRFIVASFPNQKP